MSLFGIFGQNKKEKPAAPVLPWVLLEEEVQIEEILRLSDAYPVVIFKHSTRCPASRMAFSGFQRDYDRDWEDRVKFFLVDVLANRNIADELAVQFQVIHESPQIIIVKKGVTVFHASHYSISAAVIESFIDE